LDVLNLDNRGEKAMSRLEGLTPKQKAVFDFLCEKIDVEGVTPSYDEIRKHFGLASFNSVQKYLKHLENKGYIETPWKSKKRAIKIVASKSSFQNDSEENESFTLPLLGQVAAGCPVEAIDWSDSTGSEEIPVPSHMVGQGKHFLLQVNGESMMDEGILDGDLVIVKSQTTAKTGEAIVASVDGEVTLKRFFPHTWGIELRPSHPTLDSIRVPGNGNSLSPDQNFKILGLMVGLLRTY
jgi:repressor LexA